jgi:hypothetical protein
VASSSPINRSLNQLDLKVRTVHPPMSNHAVDYSSSLRRLVAARDLQHDQSDSDDAQRRDDDYVDEEAEEGRADREDGLSGHDSDCSNFTDGDAHATSFTRRTMASISVEEELEHASISAAFAQAGPNSARQRSKLSIRNFEQAKSRSSFMEHYSSVSSVQIGLMQKALDAFVQKAKAPWFIPKARSTGKVVDVGAPAPVAAKNLLTDSVAAKPAALLPLHEEVGSVVGEKPEGLVGVGCKRTTSDRWRSVGPELQHDWAEYKSCCGLNVQFKEHTGTHIAKHSSHSVVQMQAGRFEFYSQVKSRDDFLLTVGRMLQDAASQKVPWQGGVICASCFRAVLGTSRDWMFRARAAAELSSVSNENIKMTARGHMRAPRAAPGRERIIHLLRSYAKLHGHIQPNPKGKDLNRRTYFLSVKQRKQLCQALSLFEQSIKRIPDMEEVSLHQLNAAQKHLQEKENIFLKLGTSISLLRCTTCDLLDNRCKPSYVKEAGRTLQEQAQDKADKLSHLETMQKQRNFFTQKKNQAMAQPEMLWTITLDGMDQSKTRLPHRARFSKELDGLDQMRVHAEGGFCFGGPRPVLGLLNLPDLRKDSSLCVMTLERILDIQWEHLEKEALEAERIAEAKAAVQVEAAKHDLALSQQMRDAQAAARSVYSGEAGYSAAGPGRRWPKSLHLTFDNAAGECKNQWMFRYLGLLVLHGVVQDITVSTMLVGHTHDIVDQLFSIWARMLRIHDAPTYERMRAIFRERYLSRIQGLVALMRKRTDAKPVMTAEERQQFIELQEGVSGCEWESAAASVLDEFTQFYQSTFQDSELSPHIELQSVCADIQGWLRRCETPSRGSGMPVLDNVTVPHVFGVEKDNDTGRVWLYNKFLCDSTEVKGDKVVHEYLHQPTGRYTTRALLYDSDARQLSDPFRIPPLHVDTVKLRATARKYREQAAMTSAEEVEFCSMLDRLDAARAQQKQDCSMCAELCAAYCGHGVIHRPKHSDEGEKRAANKKSMSKDKAWRAMLDHLYDKTYADVHNGMQVHTGWWTKWLKRVHEHIRPAYVARGIIDDPQLVHRQYHAHPRKLVSNEGEKPCMAEPARVDVNWFMKHGVPRIGHTAVIRTNQVKEPFWIGIVSGVRPLDAAATAELAQVNAEEAARAAEAAVATVKAQAAAAAAAAAAAVVAASGMAAAAVGLAEAPASDGVAAPKRKARAPHNSNLSMKQFEITLRYWDIHRDDWAGPLHMFIDDSKTKKTVKDKNKGWWNAKFAEHGVSEQELEDALAAAVDAGRQPPPAQGWIVDLYKLVSFYPRGAAEDKEEQTNGQALIMWGEREDILCKGKTWAAAPEGKAWKLREPSFKQVREDLTEEHCPPAPPRAQHMEMPVGAAAAAAAAGDVDVVMAAVHEEEEEKEGAALAAAPIATPSRRKTRRSNRRSVVQDDGSTEDDDDDDDDDEYEHADERNAMQIDDDDESDGDDSEADGSSSDEPTTAHPKKRQRTSTSKPRAQPPQLDKPHSPRSAKGASSKNQSKKGAKKAAGGRKKS